MAQPEGFLTKGLSVFVNILLCGTRRSSPAAAAAHGKEVIGKMLTFNMDVEPCSRWLRTTPGAAALAQPYFCTEAGLFYGRERFATARTDKEAYLLLYTLEGTGLIEQNETQVTLGPGCALLLDCRAPQNYGTAQGQSRWHHYWALIEGTGVQALASVLCPDKRPCTVELPEAPPLFDELLNRLETETAESAVTNALVLHRLLAAMAQHHLAGDSAAANRKMIEDAVVHIRTHYAEALCLDELLSSAHISKSYFLRLFRQYMGTTPYNFLLCYRITKAKELLAQTDLPVGAVAHQVGFGDESNFSTRFTAMVGQSPLRYRKGALRAR